MNRCLRSFALFFLLASSVVFAQVPRVDTISSDLRDKIDQTAEHVLASTGVPSASLAIVKDGKVVYTHAYGKARLAPPLAAEPKMAYPVGSVSKQFTAAAILLLEQQGKLSIDDPVSKYVPGLTRGNEVTIRMVLSHTSGYQDYWPEDYLMTPMLQSTTAQQIVDKWGKKPLDFDPGTKWQYSNTNYVIAGMIVEKVSGSEVFAFIQNAIFAPLHMDQVYNFDIAGERDVEGYIRHALGPLRPAPKEGKGWMFAAGELAMPAYDLALWDISMINKSLLSEKSYSELEQSVKLKDGSDTHYGLGVDVAQASGHLVVSHSGEVSGFVAENDVYPNDGVAIAVLTNQDATSAAAMIARSIAPSLLNNGPHASQIEAAARSMFVGLQHGKIDRSLFTQWCNDYFTKETVDDYASSLGPLGDPATFHLLRESLRGGMTFRAFDVTLANQKTKLRVTTYTMPDGKIEQYLVAPVE